MIQHLMTTNLITLTNERQKKRKKKVGVCGRVL